MLRVTGGSRQASSHFAKFRPYNRFYYGDVRTQSLKAPMGMAIQTWRRPFLEKQHRHKGPAADEVVDLRDKKNLELSEGIRNPMERDFYQDHTYHSQWIARDYDEKQMKQLNRQYACLIPGYEITPWIWYPGDVVEVVEGEFAGQRGSIVSLLKYRNEISVQNVNVQDITLPATETRPEQIVQREHGISVRLVKHVDPSTNAVTEVRLITVRNRETGELEKKRICMESGVMLPIPTPPPNVDGDPLNDTPYQDAEEPTYDEAEEQPLLIQRKLKAMEDHFVKQLEDSYKFHTAQAAKNYRSLREYQSDVLSLAETMLADSFARGNKFSEKLSWLEEAATAEVTHAASPFAPIPEFTPESLASAMSTEELESRMGVNAQATEGLFSEADFMGTAVKDTPTPVMFKESTVTTLAAS